MGLLNMVFYLERFPIQTSWAMPRKWQKLNQGEWRKFCQYVAWQQRNQTDFVANICSRFMQFRHGVAFWREEQISLTDPGVKGVSQLDSWGHTQLWAPGRDLLVSNSIWPPHHLSSLRLPVPLSPVPSIPQKHLSGSSVHDFHVLPTLSPMSE